MDLVRLWWSAVAHPSRAFAEVLRRLAPGWAFKVLLVFNVLISLTTNLARVVTGGALLLPSPLSFLTDRQYLLAELLIVPLVRLAAWLLGAAVIHLALRLLGQASDFDRLLQLGGIVYLVVMPYTFVVDWLSLALGVFGLGLIAWVHGVVDLLWSLTLQVIGLRTLGLPTRQAVPLTLASSLVTMPLLMSFAR